MNNKPKLILKKRIDKFRESDNEVEIDKLEDEICSDGSDS